MNKDEFIGIALSLYDNCEFDKLRLYCTSLKSRSNLIPYCYLFLFISTAEIYRITEDEQFLKLMFFYEKRTELLLREVRDLHSLKKFNKIKIEFWKSIEPVKRPNYANILP